MSDRDTGHTPPVARLERLRPVQDAPLALPSSTAAPYEAAPADSGAEGSIRAVVLAWMAEIRRRWILASFAFLVVVVPVGAYIVLAVPTYTAEGVLQVSSQSGAFNPLAELTGEGQPLIQTEVEIIKRREFIGNVLKQLNLHVVDPGQKSFISTDLEVTLHGASPVRAPLQRVRASLASAETTELVFNRVNVTIEGVDETSLRVEVGKKSRREYGLVVGEVLDDPSLRLSFAQMPIDVGERFTFSVVSNGPLISAAMARLTVDPIGDTRRPTNLVEISYRDVDREIARAVVRTIMQRYLDQSLDWQTLSASATSEFIQQRLDEAEDRLRAHEEALRSFAEAERAIQLDIQAKTTIESAAALEVEKTQVELQQRIVSQAMSSLRTAGPTDNVNVTGFFDDPVLSANVAALSESETRYAVLRATLTDEHPEVAIVAAQVAMQRKEIARLLRSTRRNLAARRTELDKRLKTASDSLAGYPDKEIQLARRTRDVEVSQRLYSFLLEKHQESEILEASTTTDKRVVDDAALPHKMTSPTRRRFAAGGALGGLALAFAAVWLARLLQRKLPTIQAITSEVSFPVFGTVPAIGNVKASKKRRRKKKDAAASRLTPEEIWEDAHGVGPEAFRALAVNVSLAPAVPGRARIVQVTSSQPGEGKSTVLANLAVALAKSGAKVLLVDLDLRKPVQHRVWGLRRSPGYSDLSAQDGTPDQADEFLTTVYDGTVDVVTAGTRLPDTLRALMSDRLEANLAYWASKYDYVLVDGPPAFVADATVLGQVVDLLLVVARPGVVERGNLRQTSAAVSRLGTQIGFVMNGVERKHAEYYYYGGSYSYSYNRTYGSATDSDADAEQEVAS